MLRADAASKARRDAGYPAARQAAQVAANSDGFDRGLEYNALFGQWSHKMLPGRQYRAGHELQCEVVMCEDLSKCQLNHGPVRS